MREALVVPDEATLARIAIELGADRVPRMSSRERKVRLSPARPSLRTLAKLRALIRDGQDPLGEAFATLRSPETRRSMGATYTPASIVASMTDWAAAHSPIARVVDPGAGSGRFAVAAGRRFPRAEIIAVEVDPLAALLARANLAVSGMARRSQVVVQDYRKLSLDQTDERTLYLGNPPYVRHHQIAPEWKSWLASTSVRQGLVASTLAGLHVYFFLATACLATPGDVGAFITSAEWLDVNYGSLVRELLLDGLGGTAVHILDPKIAPFEGTATTGAITCFEAGKRPTSMRLRRVERVRDLGALSGGRAFGRQRLQEARRWTPLLRAAKPVPEGHIELGELCRVHRGAVTGNNGVWVQPPGATDLPESVLFPSVTKARELFRAGDALRSVADLRQVIDLPHDLDVFGTSERKVIERFLREAKRAGVPDGYIAQNRKAWWSVGLRAPAPILATYMARREPAFVRNIAAARHINIAHGLYPREELTAQELDRLAAALRERMHIASGRTYAGGLTKFEPREMERLPVPELARLRA